MDYSEMLLYKPQGKERIKEGDKQSIWKGGMLFLE